ncbi:HesA/MoeB/ThiF family protein [Francisella sp. 19X1-34]|uniref:HesA/MoeB/ThiF family protein n=1 Tax=Francisella sp. 19X1-34 TaxID=3087177 RepID=UPI002E330767|nr:HesA/MoeB/ThiF family protein [Francisella sp. 19X1-34]MED7788613.1 HesA/MoeB/ThiF family protein [Francisella sp. 19X1-34]
MSKYSRQTCLPNFDEDTQLKLLNAKVAIVGAGGVGSPLALYLAAAGVGNIILIDNDVVELHNLQRQILYRERQVGQLKSEIAARELYSLNSDINTTVYAERLTTDNAKSIFNNCDLIIDGTDNFDSRYIISDACIELEKPYIQITVDRFYGSCSLYNYKSDTNYRDVHKVTPKKSGVVYPKSRGVLGPLVGTIATIGATQALKLLGGFDDPYAGKILYDALDFKLTKIPFVRK